MERQTGKSMYAAFVARGGWWVAAQAPLLLVAFVLPRWTGTRDLAFDSPLDWIGVALGMAGFVMSMAGLASLGRSLSPFPQPLDSATLRTGGLYRIVRHPVYAGLGFASVGWAAWSHSVPGLAFCVALIYFFDRKASREEAWLRERYPDYAAYARRVRKLIPWVY